jgi:hypothetical protein
VESNELIPNERALRAQFAELLAATDRQKPSDEAVKALDKFMRENPDLWKLVDVTHSSIVEQFVSLMAPGPARRKLVLQEYESVRRDLEASAESPLEQRLAREVALCWLDLTYSRFHHAHFLTVSPEAVSHWSGRVDAAQRRFLRAANALANMRRLKLPPIQLNVAQNQINQTNS